MANNEYEATQLIHRAGMVLVINDGIFEGPHPQDAFSKAMDYKVELAKYLSEVKDIMNNYENDLPKEHKEFTEQDNAKYKTFKLIAEKEKEKGLLRKLLKN